MAIVVALRFRRMEADLLQPSITPLTLLITMDKKARFVFLQIPGVLGRKTFRYIHIIGGDLFLLQPMEPNWRRFRLTAPFHFQPILV